MSKIKQVIVMRKDLNMRKGKIAAQAGHACVAALFKTMNSIENFSWRIDENGEIRGEDSSILSEWLNNSFTKICVYVNSEEDLLNISKLAKEKNIIHSLILDSGFTEFNGVPTYTCIGFEPLPDNIIDEITGNLPLF